MTFVKDLLMKLMLAALLLGGAGQASAQHYSITIDTATLGDGPAYLGLYFLGLADAAPATATVSQLAGDLSGPAQLSGAVSGALPGPLVFGNGGELVQAVTLGSVLRFSLSLTLGSGDSGLQFGWALFNDSSYLGADGDLGVIALQPGAVPYTVSTFSAASSVTAVPEPATFVLLLAGLLCLATLRMRRAG
ncbi:NF038129 family PEP-CTERM protein [Duganella sp.]|uniref:NF038129 family PEP-CTERM protein n=1 Tax=Duganella sp. TaxID=1904440 RepID=UPI0031E40A0F